MHSSRSRRALVTAILLTATSACGLVDRSPDPGRAVDAFVQRLRSGDVEASALTDAGDAATAEQLLTDASDELGTRPQFPLAGPVAVEEPQETTAGDRRPSASARVRVRWRLPTGTWAYDSTLALRLIDGDWKVAWSPTLLHPRLSQGHSLRARWTAPERGPILSAGGEPLFELRPVVTVYVQPRRVRDLDAVLAVLDETLQIEPAPLREGVEAADRDHLVDVVTLRVEDYAPLRTTLQPVPGLVFRKDWRPLTPTRHFARALLGRVGPPTAEVLETAGPGFGPGDLLGVSGLQQTFQRRLAGRPGLRIAAVDANGDEVATLHETAPVPGEALRTTLDPRIQRAADDALSAIARPSAIVAVRSSTGEVLAVANGPDGGDVDLALTGRYPLAATFDALVQAGTTLGLGGRWHPGVDAFPGEIPDDVDPATGHRRILASPLVMASVAAATADGTWRPPVLLPDHAQPGDGPQDLDRPTRTALAELIGPAALQSDGGRRVHAITGVGEGRHAWVVAFRGDLALAILVEGDGGVDAESAMTRFFQRV